MTSKSSLEQALELNIDANFLKTESQLRIESMAECEFQCSKITDDLFVSGFQIAALKELLEWNGICRIVNCSASVVPNYHENSPEFQYLSLKMVDGNQDDIFWFFCEVCQFVLEGIAKKQKILIHCERGISRSCSLAASFLMLNYGYDMRKSMQIVSSARKVANPNTAFTCNLKEIESILYGEHKDCDLLFRSAYHLPHDPETFLLKLCRNKSNREIILPTSSVLDPKGVFVIRPRCSSALKVLFVWQGTLASDETVQLAVEKARMLLGIITTAHDIVIVKSGEEPNEFNNLIQKNYQSKTHETVNFPDLFDCRPTLDENRNEIIQIEEHRAVLSSQVSESTNRREDILAKIRNALIDKPSEVIPTAGLNNGGNTSGSFSFNSASPRYTPRYSGEESSNNIKNITESHASDLNQVSIASSDSHSMNSKGLKKLRKSDLINEKRLVSNNPQIKLPLTDSHYSNHTALSPRSELSDIQSNDRYSVPMRSIPSIKLPDVYSDESIRSTKVDTSSISISSFNIPPVRIPKITENEFENGSSLTETHLTSGSGQRIMTKGKDPESPKSMRRTLNKEQTVSRSETSIRIKSNSIRGLVDMNETNVDSSLVTLSPTGLSQSMKENENLIPESTNSTGPISSKSVTSGHKTDNHSHHFMSRLRSQFSKKVAPEEAMQQDNVVSKEIKNVNATSRSPSSFAFSILMSGRSPASVDKSETKHPMEVFSIKDENTSKTTTTLMDAVEAVDPNLQVTKTLSKSNSNPVNIPLITTERSVGGRSILHSSEKYPQYVGLSRGPTPIEDFALDAGMSSARSVTLLLNLNHKRSSSLLHENRIESVRSESVHDQFRTTTPSHGLSSWKGSISGGIAYDDEENGNVVHKNPTKPVLFQAVPKMGSSNSTGQVVVEKETKRSKGSIHYCWQAMGIYDDEDLNEEAMFLLISPSLRHYIWIGSHFPISFDENSNESRDEINWLEVVQSCGKGDVPYNYFNPELLNDVDTIIIRSGEETDEFLEEFNDGM